MTTETGISTFQIDNLAVAILGRRATYEELLFARAIEAAVLQSPEIQALRDLLRETRQQLPLAAQFWNEDDEPERGSRNVKRVMELIAKIDALPPSTPAQLAAKQ